MKFRGGMNELVRQASRLQRKVEQRREELKIEEHEMSAADDRIKITVNGGLEVVNVKIDPSLLQSEGLEMVQDLIVATTNAALKKARDYVDAEIEKVTGGINIPGIG